MARSRCINPLRLAALVRKLALKNYVNWRFKEIIVIGFTVDVDSLFGDDYLIINDAVFYLNFIPK
ncbi:hypothetical protein VSVS12_04123 [Vibrio scophthalmi]|nr:hypothetical protein VSVS12_04123 [Vibrio scophthalmi]